MSDDYFEGDVEGGTERAGRSLLLHPIALTLLAVALFFIGFLSFLFFGNEMDEDQATGSSDQTETTTSPSSETTAGDDETATSTDAEATETNETDGATPPDGAFVEATLDLDAGPGPGLFKLSGRVPDAETATALIEAAELSYAPFVESDLEVDETLDPAPWLATSPRLIGLLPSVTDGTIRVVDEKVELIARSPNPEYLALLEGALTLLSELPVEVADPTITDLVPPRFIATVADGAISLTGEVPSDQIRELLEGGAAAAYGPENVESDLSINDGTYTSFWMYTMPGIFQLFSSFPRYELRVIDGVSSGSLQGGVSFDVDSTQISEQAAQVLNIGVAILARDLSIFMTVEGHTDSSGPDDYNMELSEARATSVVAYLEAAGIQQARMIAVGAGESNPIADNDTTDGKAQNRRVEFLFGPPPSG